VRSSSAPSISRPSSGLSAFIGQVPYEGKELPYVVFITPALLSITMMYNSFFENTYASFVRMYYQKTFDAMMATPLSLEDIIAGEIVWGATKSVIATAIMLGVVSLFGLVEYPMGLLVLPLSFLGGIAFGTAGMVFTGLVPSIDMFNLPIFLFITPMFLFSGTFFPTDALPSWAQGISHVPSHPLVNLCGPTLETAPRMIGPFISSSHLGFSIALMYAGSSSLSTGPSPGIVNCRM